MPKKTFRKKFQQKKRPLRECKDGSEVYGIITAVLGDCRFLVHCEDKVERQCTLKGSFRNRVYVNLEDSVIVSLRVEFDKLSTISNDKNNKKEKGDIIWKYYPTEWNILVSNKIIKYLKNGVPSTEFNFNIHNNNENEIDHEFDHLINDSTPESKDNELDIDIDVDLIDI